jgi:hypothetical protein
MKFDEAIQDYFDKLWSKFTTRYIYVMLLALLSLTSECTIVEWEYIRSIKYKYGEVDIM